MQSIILAGGFGTRLQSVVKDNPKPMAPIETLPFLAFIFIHLKKNNITDVVLSVGYLKEKIIDFFGESYLGIKIKYAIESEPLGTGGAILNSLQFIKKNQPVLILNGDTFLQIDYKKLFDFHHEKKSNLTIALRKVDNSDRYGSVQLDNKNLITNFVEKNISNNECNLINGGIYAINPQIFTNFNLPKKFSFENDFLCKYTNIIKPFGFISEDYFIDIGIPEDYRKANEELPKFIKNKALFLDRDGVINHDYGHVGKIENFHFIDGIFDLCKNAQDKGYLIIVVTNQSGIAKGYYSEKDFLDLTKWMENEFLKRQIKITKTYFCPYHIDGKVKEYQQDSFDRKPNPGMILKAIKEFNIDPLESILIGDNDTDIEAGKSANINKRIKFNGEKISRNIIPI